MNEKGWRGAGEIARAIRDPEAATAALRRDVRNAQRELAEAGRAEAAGRLGATLFLFDLAHDIRVRPGEA